MIALVVNMPLDEFMLPGEEIRYSSPPGLIYGGKSYELIVTDKRLLLYNRRGTFFKKDDFVSQKVEEVQNITYRENGMLKKEGVLQIIAKTKFTLTGRPSVVKAIYQQILQFI